MYLVPLPLYYQYLLVPCTTASILPVSHSFHRDPLYLGYHRYSFLIPEHLFSVYLRATPRVILVIMHIATHHHTFTRASRVHGVLSAAFLKALSCYKYPRMNSAYPVVVYHRCPLTILSRYPARVLVSRKAHSLPCIRFALFSYSGAIRFPFLAHLAFLLYPMLYVCSL